MVTVLYPKNGHRSNFNLVTHTIGRLTRNVQGIVTLCELVAACFQVSVNMFLHGIGTVGDAFAVPSHVEQWHCYGVICIRASHCGGPSL